MLGLCLGAGWRQPDRTSPRRGVFVYSSGRKMKDDARAVAAIASHRIAANSHSGQLSAKRGRNRVERVVRAASQPAASSQPKARSGMPKGTGGGSTVDVMGWMGSDVMGMDRSVDGDGNGGVCQFCWSLAITGAG